MTAIMSGVAPVKAAVDQILAACQALVKSGILPGVEQKAGEVVAWATSLLPQAVQQVAQPGIGPVQQGIPPAGGPGPMAPPPGMGM